MATEWPTIPLPPATRAMRRLSLVVISGLLVINPLERGDGGNQDDRVVIAEDTQPLRCREPAAAACYYRHFALQSGHSSLPSAPQAACNIFRSLRLGSSLSTDIP